MTKTTLVAACIGVLALAGCEGMTAQERMITGGLAGATVGVLTATALRADRNWTLIAGLAGATAGTLVGRNANTGDCAYARGDGTYRIAPCPN